MECISCGISRDAGGRGAKGAQSEAGSTALVCAVASAARSLIVTAFERRSFLLGALGGVGVGAGAGMTTRYVSQAGKYAYTPEEYGRVSYAQQGEDLILENICVFLQIKRPSYIDIGAHQPIVGNNTYAFYRTESRGVLVEPNPELTPELRRMRPRDVVLEIGIGAKAADEEAPYYLIEGDGQLNTFSEEQVGRLRAEKGKDVVKGVIKRTLVNVNKVLAEHFPAGGPDIFSTDTEGYDVTILRSLDFDRFRPKVFCVETLAGLEVSRPILDHMQSKDYEVRGGNFVNTVFVDARLTASRP
jgi:methyltransferase FkbM-like protein